MSSSYFSVSLSNLTTVGNRLNDTSAAVRSGANFTPAHGASAYGEVTAAVGDFKDDWDNAVARLEEKIGNWGDIVLNAGKVMGDHDRSLADSLRPPAP